MSSQDNNQIIVFGAGQMRTGTNSLKYALEHLYQGKCFHMDQVFRNKGYIKLWQKSIDNKSLTKLDAEKLFGSYCCAVDLPVAAFYEDMLKWYPSAKVILTKRDPDSWIRSVRETTFRKDLPSFLDWIWYWMTDTFAFWKMIYSLYPMTFKRPLHEITNDSILKECFVKHNEAVISLVPKERLLIFEVRDGWGPLCEFLGKKVPDIPFPNVNSKDEFQAEFIQINKYLRCKVAIKITIPLCFIGFSFWYLKLRNR